MATMLAGLAARFRLQEAKADKSWANLIAPSLTNIGEVDQLAILPLVERLTGKDSLLGEAGVSYLLRTDRTTLLFDTGLNLKGRPQSALMQNAARLNADLQRIDGVVISHLHVDHIGGPRNARRRTFSFSGEPLEPERLPAYVPTSMEHDRADVTVTTEPRVIAPGIALLPPIPRTMFWLGPVSEQCLVVNIRRFGLVLISGCGHPGIERMLAVAERVLDVPIKGVIGGLHLPVHALGTPLMIQATLGNPNWPWRPINEQDVTSAIQELTDRGPNLIALSSHDSTPWTYDAFARAFGDRYRTLRVGEELAIPL